MKRWILYTEVSSSRTSALPFFFFDVLTSLEKTTDGLNSNKAENLHIIISSMVGSPFALMITVVLLYVS